MEIKRYFTPCDGLVVRDPLTMEALPAEGRAVAVTAASARYWSRRKKDGDCTETPMPGPAHLPPDPGDSEA